MRTRLAIGIVTMLVAGAGCGDAGSPVMPVSPGPALHRAAGLDGATAAIADVLDRVVPTLSGGSAAALGAALRSVLASTSANDGAALPGALTHAHATLGAYADAAGPSAGESPDLDTIALALSAVDGAMANPNASHASAAVAPRRHDP